MKKSVFSVVAAVLMTAVVSGAQAADLKIGMVNFQQALNEVAQGKTAKLALKNEFDAKQKKLDMQQQELKNLQDQLVKDQGVLSKDVAAAKQKSFTDKYMELQKSMQSYREDLMQKESKMTGQILQNLKTVVAEIGQKEGYTMILESSQDAVLYAQSKDDLSSRVIGEYNKRFTGPLNIQ